MKRMTETIIRLCKEAYREGHNDGMIDSHFDGCNKHESKKWEETDIFKKLDLLFRENEGDE